ncbi:MAG: hypothetical protein SGBAC_005533 [Bacillariaceae sp.]
MTSNPIRSSWILIASITLILSVNYNAVCCQALSPIGNIRVEESFSSSGRSVSTSSFTKPPTSAKATSLSATSSSSSPIPPPPALSVPVWSLAVKDDDDYDDTNDGDDDGDADGNTTAIARKKTKTNMNIMTYCMPVSIGPPKLWALSIFKDTKTRELFLLDHLDDDSTPTTPKQGILQLLTKDHHALVPILGKKSGRDINKEQACAEAGWKWAPSPSSSPSSPPPPPSTSAEESSTEEDCQVIPSCSLYLQVQVVESCNSKMDAGDHWVVLCQIVNTGEWDSERNCLRWRTMVADDEDTAVPAAAVEGIDGIGDNAMYSGWLRQEGHL